MTRIKFFEPRGELTPDLVEDVLSLVLSEKLDLDLEQLSHHELLLIYDWAIREYQAASDLITRRRPMPYLVRAHMSPYTLPNK